MKRLTNTGRAAWFGSGVVLGLALAELLPRDLSYVLDLIQALDFVLS